jgi:hypothetical protein
MGRAIWILAIFLIAVGVAGLIALNMWHAAFFYANNAQPWGTYGMFGPGMMGYVAYGYVAPGIAAISLDQAVTRAQTFLTSFNNPDLVLAEVMEFSSNFYVRVKEKSTGVNAFEILLSPHGGISPEPGPNMMWNTKYSPVAHAMGGWFTSSTRNSVTAAQAKENAQEYLDTYLNGAQVAEDADAFYGYYTIDVLRDGKPFGMLSVNGTTGTVWYHAWHGTFIGARDIR